MKEAATESLTTVRPYSNEIHAQAQLWLKKDPKASYEAWKKCLPARCKHNMCYYFSGLKKGLMNSISTGQESLPKPQSKAELRKQYLLEKYAWKWKQFMRSRKGDGLFPRLLKLSHNNWLRQVVKKNILNRNLLKNLQWSLLMLYLSQVLFTPATQAARQAACTIVEALTTIPSRKQQVLDLLTRCET